MRLRWPRSWTKEAIIPIQKHAALRGIADKIVIYEIP
jgi:hypothetical protein